jgi:adenine-specific DNA-methyltransferase
MRYIGNKNKLLSNISECVCKINNIDKISNFIDCFAGTGVVANHFKDDFNTTTCDLLYSSHIQCYSKIVWKCNDWKRVKEEIAMLNNLQGVDGFISQLYSEAGSGNRLFFSKENGNKVDAIIIKLNEMKMSKNYHYLNYIFLEAVSKVSNTTGVYGAFLKKLNANALKPLVLKLELLDNVNDNTHTSLYGDSMSFKDSFKKDSILYLDPPYNNRCYSSNYHLLETIAKGVVPKIKLVGTTESKAGLTEGLVKSKWCQKKTVGPELEKYLQMNPDIIIMSYNSDGLLSKKDVLNLMEKYGKTTVTEVEYKKYKSNNTCSNIKNIVEYIFVCDKRHNVESLKSPIQWTGGKGRIVNEIKKYIPKQFDTYYEFFLGGGSMLFNLLPEKAVCCELNPVLCEFYNVVKYRPNDFISKMEKYSIKYNNMDLISRKEYYLKNREKFNHLRCNFKTNGFKIACLFMFLNKTCFNSIYRENSKGGFNVPPHCKNKQIVFYNKELIYNISHYLNKSNTTIICSDYKELELEVKKGDFVYLDPPYFNTFTNYTKHLWDNNQDVSVLHVFKNLTSRGIACIMSNQNDQEYIDIVNNTLEVGTFKIVPISISRCMSKNIENRLKKENEIIIVNKYCN